MSSVEESQWFHKALHDEACYHSTLFVSQAHQALIAGRGHLLSADCYQHKGEAIKQINKRLSDDGQVVEDGTIAAIACLAAYEVRSILSLWCESTAFLIRDIEPKWLTGNSRCTHKWP